MDAYNWIGIAVIAACVFRGVFAFARDLGIFDD